MFVTFVTTLLALDPAADLAADPAGPPPTAIAGGSEVAPCGWPSVVRMEGGCSGTLVHPQVVLYASHCGTGMTQVLLGDEAATATPVAVDQCLTHPLATGDPGGTDVAMCTLAAPVSDVPIVPILMGCEEQWLEPDRPVTSVGFGIAPDGPSGIKREVTYPILEVFAAGNVVQAGARGAVLCTGDSGGGTFVQLWDGSWRAFGINSAVSGTPCVDGASVLAMMAATTEWIESTTGFDVTPCHDPDGTWNPGPDCGSFPLDPVAGGGAWPTCETGPLSGPGSTCGAPAFGPDDLAAPVVTIVDPTDGAQFDLDPMTQLADVAIAIEVDDADGWGIEQTWLRIDGEDVPGSEDDFMPWEIPALQFGEGIYLLEAVARDWAGNEGVSTAVQIVVGDPPAAGTTGGDSGGGDSTGAGSTTGFVDPAATTGAGASTGAGDTGSTSGAASGGGDGGCSCRAGGAGRRGWLALFAIGRLGARRRRRS